MDALDNFGSALLLKDRVYDTLKLEIIIGRFKPGDRLSIMELSNKLNISAAPVREALNLLSKEGLVELHPHRQAIVTAGSYKEYAISADLRKMLEPYAAKMSVGVVPQNRIDMVREQLNAVLENPSDMEAYIASDIALHELLYLYAGSRLLIEVLEMIKAHNMRYRYLREREGEEQTITCIISTHEHLKILEALQSRDAERIYKAVYSHIEQYEKRNDPKTLSERQAIEEKGSEPKTIA